MSRAFLSGSTRKRLSRKRSELRPVKFYTGPICCACVRKPVGHASYLPACEYVRGLTPDTPCDCSQVSCSSTIPGKQTTAPAARRDSRYPGQVNESMHTLPRVHACPRARVCVSANLSPHALLAPLLLHQTPSLRRSESIRAPQHGSSAAAARAGPAMAWLIVGRSLPPPSGADWFSSIHSSALRRSYLSLYRPPTRPVSVAAYIRPAGQADLRASLRQRWSRRL